jgi:Flp pilus assembly protein TadB
VTRLVLRIIRIAMLWGRWAAQHPLVAIGVYVLELCVAPAVLWSIAGPTVALIVLVVEVVVIALMWVYVRYARRRRGLAPLPPLWRKQTPPGP